MAMTIRHILPPADIFKELRDSANWGIITLEHAQSCLAKSLLGITAYVEGKPVAMARVIGDGVLNVYIQDVVVAPNHRGEGIGKAVISALIRDMKNTIPANCTVDLLSALGQEGFYSTFSFAPRPDKAYGAGMFAKLADLTDRTET